MYYPKPRKQNIEQLKEENEEAYQVLLSILNNYADGIYRDKFSHWGLEAVRETVYGLFEKGWIRIQYYQDEKVNDEYVFSLLIFDPTTGDYKCAGYKSQ